MNEDAWFDFENIESIDFVENNDTITINIDLDKKFLCDNDYFYKESYLDDDYYYCKVEIFDKKSNLIFKEDSLHQCVIGDRLGNRQGIEYRCKNNVIFINAALLRNRKSELWPYKLFIYYPNKIERKEYKYFDLRFIGQNDEGLFYLHNEFDSVEKRTKHGIIFASEDGVSKYEEEDIKLFFNDVPDNFFYYVFFYNEEFLFIFDMFQKYPHLDNDFNKDLHVFYFSKMGIIPKDGITKRYQNNIYISGFGNSIEEERNFNKIIKIDSNGTFETILNFHDYGMISYDYEIRNYKLLDSLLILYLRSYEPVVINNEEYKSVIKIYNCKTKVFSDRPIKYVIKRED